MDCGGVRENHDVIPLHELPGEIGRVRAHTIWMRHPGVFFWRCAAVALLRSSSSTLCSLFHLQVQNQLYSVCKETLDPFNFMGKNS